MIKTPIQFYKMHGLGNDFVVINTIHQPIDISSLPIQQIAHRQLGIGFDQLLLIEASHRADFFCRIFNSDGSEATQCGNGLRCIARLVHEQGLHTSSALTVETHSGIFNITILDYQHIQITMGIPQLQQNSWNIPLKNHPPLVATVLNLGNPHAIIRVPALATTPTHLLGKEISTHALFPQGINVGFMEIIQPNHIRLCTFERGAGETYACGSNASAAVAAGIINRWLENKVTVEYPYGTLEVEWPGGTHPMVMQGPAEYSFSGIFPHHPH
ncbi:MAG: diaminopimelate epimerase [Gammaproteobacteria bacterium RIFCSPHIGHO2_12_FULL_41_20]|nr:MAG: diaminopimelate epimerase [Gammaproteobacteria bacterium RIFCSPHIGHO2_12_FULL_41_20]